MVSNSRAARAARREAVRKVLSTQEATIKGLRKKLRATTAKAELSAKEANARASSPARVLHVRNRTSCMLF